MILRYTHRHTSPPSLPSCWGMVEWGGRGEGWGQIERKSNYETLGGILLKNRITYIHTALYRPSIRAIWVIVQQAVKSVGLFPDAYTNMVSPCSPHIFLCVALPFFIFLIKKYPYGTVHRVFTLVQDLMWAIFPQMPIIPSISNACMTACSLGDFE